MNQKNATISSRMMNFNNFAGGGAMRGSSAEEMGANDGSRDKEDVMDTSDDMPTTQAKRCRGEDRHVAFVAEREIVVVQFML